MADTEISHELATIGGSTAVLSKTSLLGSESQDGQGKDTDGSSSDLAGSPLKFSQAKGTWLHAGYHLTTGTAGASTPNLPAALAGLGWGPGVFFLTLFSVASFYTTYLLIIVLDNLEKEGERTTRFRDLSSRLLGRKWSLYVVAPLQYVVCFTTVVSFVLLGGQSVKAIFSACTHGNEKLTLSEFIVIFGFLSTILSQPPTFHSLRHLNLLSLLSSLAYTVLAVCGSILAGYSKKDMHKDYSLQGTHLQKVMNAFNALSILSTIYGNALVVETQATLSPPIGINMLKGLCVCYTATIMTFFPVAIAGYWAFGSSSNGNIFLSMMSKNGKSYIPIWMFVLGNMCMIIQLIAGSVLYSQPTFDILEGKIIHGKHSGASSRNYLARILSRTLFMLLATFLAALLPFFSDFNALVGSLGYTPIMFIFPILFYL